jgi:phosphoenolpyruvate carboxylase
MRERWPFFQTRIDMLEMVLAKAEAELARLYDQRLVEADLQVLGSQLRERLRQAGVAVLRLTGQAELLEHHPETLVFIAVRNTYLDPLHLLQIELLARARAAGESQPAALDQALLVSVAGIAAGLRNTG